jgi:predicted esterase
MLGFSMGGGLAIFSAFTTRFQLGGVISMSGYLLGKSVLEQVSLAPLYGHQ